MIRAAVSAGVEDFYVVTGYSGAEVSLFLDQLAERCLNPIHNENWDRKENGLSVLMGKLQRIMVF